MKPFDFSTATVQEKLDERDRRDECRRRGLPLSGEGTLPYSWRQPPEKEPLIPRAAKVAKLEAAEAAIAEEGKGDRSVDAKVRVMRILQAWAPDADEYRIVVLEGNPHSKARPRFSRTGGVYSSPVQRDAERATKKVLARAFPEPLSGNLAVVCGFYRKNHLRIDVDNMLKHVMDAANETVWADDYQVTAMSGYVELDLYTPRTVIGVATYECSLSRSAIEPRTCEGCGKQFTPHYYASRQRFCSRTCVAMGREDLKPLVPCLHCATPFRRKVAMQKFCANTCRLAHLHARNTKTP